MSELVGIFIADRAGSPMRRLVQAEFVPGRGIVGDRYYTGTGKWSPEVRAPKNEVTLVDIDEVNTFNASHGLALRAEDLRRNLVTRGVDLNELVGADFRVGDVVLRGVKLCDPCEYLARGTHQGVVEGLMHRAGLRAAVMTGGRIDMSGPVPIRRIA